MEYSDPDCLTSLPKPTRPELSAMGETVLITGVLGGIGKGIAESWATERASGIIITGRNVDVLEVADDITSEASVAAAKEAVGKIDVLIDNAGSLDLGPIGVVKPTKFFSDLQVNVLGSYLVTHHFLAQTDGVNTVAAVMAGYTTSKLALVRIVENLRAEIDSLKPYAKDSAGLSGSWTWDIEEMEAHKEQIVRDNLLGRAFPIAKLGKSGHRWT
ncbi:NAD(P)-binding protein [Hypoxylon sp. FL1150]|nr:NAD(P)-binding protein [Hypoxylon sp. FL1150]